jgi:hypothetical protein
VQKQMILVPADEFSRIVTRIGGSEKQPECGKSGDLDRDGFVVVPEKIPVAHKDTPLTEDERKAAALKAAEARQSRGMVRAPGRPGRGGGKMNEIKTIINYTDVFTTTAATDNAQVVLVRPSNGLEWSNLIAIWDECIVDSGHIDFTVSVSNSYTTDNGVHRAVVCFDPFTSTALSTLSQGLQHSQHLQFTTTNAFASGTCAQTPQAVNQRGFWRFSWKTPRGQAISGNAPTYFGHMWSPTSDPSDNYGTLRFYIPQSGATGTQVIYYTWTLNMRFRCRS